MNQFDADLPSVAKRLADALAEEKRIRQFGQSPECGQVQWESLRDMRRQSANQTEEALAAYEKLMQATTSTGNDNGNV